MQQRQVNTIRELVMVLIDGLRHGDLGGHLAAWWRVVTGRVLPEDTASLPSKGGEVALGLGDLADCGGGDAGPVLLEQPTPAPVTLPSAKPADEGDEAQQALLFYYYGHPSASQHEAGEALGRSQAWVAQSLVALEQAGRVIRNNGTVKVVSVD